ncbi:EthD domain-containing protein [Arthrobacter globiformis]|uniref:EthD domain-containing protein n=1 Tax=Arthrobacter globiformis TaxID=1665 RepID=A0A328HFJ6_ARTGO|nr:EthD domain-containing protein [Arthrobacter globiformis]RAM37327.1 hypothetical protein DBZ45_10980 [Arthrobacter globiformis]
MPYLRQLTLLQRKPGISRGEFQRYWSEVHAPMVRQLPHIISYTQHHVTASGARENYPAPDVEVDGIVEFVFEDADGAGKAFSGELGKHVLVDAENFISAMVVLTVTSIAVIARDGEATSA